MAHNHIVDFALLYERTTLGQLLLLDENALDYIMLTNPFGSGDEAKGEERSATSSRAPARAARGKKRYASREDVPAVQQVLKDEMQVSQTTLAGVTRGKPHLAAYVAAEIEKGRDAD